jgi:hypothetical protein
VLSVHPLAVHGAMTSARNALGLVHRRLPHYASVGAFLRTGRMVGVTTCAGGWLVSHCLNAPIMGTHKPCEVFTKGSTRVR